MPPSRRSFLRIAGATAVIGAAAAGGVGAFVATRAPSAALGPWRAAGGPAADPRLKALSYAILAPNPHNRQPWLVDLGRPDEILLFCDRTRLLPETDPFDRQIVIGLGCFLELLHLSAAEDGVHAEIEAFPEGADEAHLDGRPIARVAWRQDAQVSPDPLFASALERRSTKEPFDTQRPVADDSLEALRQQSLDTVVVNTSNAPKEVAALRDLTWRAHRLEMETPRTLMESVDLMRIGKAEIEANPDGIDIGGAFPETLKLLGLLTRETLADPGSTAFAEGLKMYRAMMESAMAYVWLNTPDNGRIAQLEAGRAWLRVNLAATRAGLALHPISQALQEYPEMATLYAEVHDRLGARGDARVQMLGRLGYGPRVPPSPRWPLETRLARA